MTHKISFLLVTGAALLLAPLHTSQAQQYSRGGTGRSGAYAGRGYYGGGGFYRGGNRYYRPGYGRSRYFYRGSYYYYDPFFFGFGYPAYYYGGYGPGYGVGYYGYGENYPPERVYRGRIASDVEDTRREDGKDAGESGGRYSPQSMSRAVQSELRERGYYKGPVDGEFGQGTAEALRSFQREKGLKVTGRLDERTLKALGFDQR